MSGRLRPRAATRIPVAMHKHEACRTRLLFPQYRLAAGRYLHCEDLSSRAPWEALVVRSLAVSTRNRKQPIACGAARQIAWAILVMAVLSTLALFGGCGGNGGAGLSARQVLDRGVHNLVSLKSYRYAGTSELTFERRPVLNNKSKFVVDLKLNDAGALDGHMVVDSAAKGSSYETYTYRGNEYTRVEGGDWTRTARDGSGGGYGMASADARAVIARFADLAEDLRFEGTSPDSYVVALTMGEKYSEGAASIMGTDLLGGRASSGLEAGKGNHTTMTLTVSRKTFHFTAVVMKDTTTGTPQVGCMMTVTRGTYSRLDKPVDITPPPEALAAPGQ